MNLFYLDQDLDVNARCHVDKHVPKMQLECAQMMCTTHWIDKYLGYVPRALNSSELAKLKEVMRVQRPLSMEERDFPYLVCHHNHPCTIWIRESLPNYEWAFCYAHSLSIEQMYRTGGTHKSFEVIKRLPDLENMEDVGSTPFKLAMKIMPDELKSSDPIDSYRNFYVFDKYDFAKWTGRGQPWWWNHERLEKVRSFTNVS